MSTITLRIPDNKDKRLKQYAKTRFEVAAKRGDTKRGLELLDKLDKHFEEQSVKLEYCLFYTVFTFYVNKLIALTVHFY